MEAIKGQIHLFFTGIFLLSASILMSCGNAAISEETVHDSTLSCKAKIPSRFAGMQDSTCFATGESTTHGMKWIPAGEIRMGANDENGRPDEYPIHAVKISGFWIDETEVTNAQFRNFIDATGYVTTAEKDVDWGELKKQLPTGTPKPADSLLKASSLVFTMTTTTVNLADVSQWWTWKRGADWKHPRGPGSDIKGKENYPVVQVSWTDAQAYCQWSGKRLPTEAEWEMAARGGQAGALYAWGNEPIDKSKPKANTWQGTFPLQNTNRDGFVNAAPVKQYAPNGFGLYDMAGNVWEWCSDWYRADYYQNLAGKNPENPKGPEAGYDPDEPSVPKKVIRGGSFLCHDSYCSGYRVSARMKTSSDTGLEHTGFRCVKDK